MGTPRAPCGTFSKQMEIFVLPRQGQNLGATQGGTFSPPGYAHYNIDV